MLYLCLLIALAGAAFKAPGDNSQHALQVSRVSQQIC